MKFSSFLLNPWSLTFPMWVAAAVAKEAALQATDVCITFACQRFDPLPSRTGTKPLYKNVLDRKDYAFLLMNSFVEMIFSSHLCYNAWYSSYIQRSWPSFGILNGPIALLLLILFNDMLYAPAHRLLHHPAVYPYIHKHHHRSIYPSRGNIDARNEHPIEQMIAMALWMTAIYMVAFSTGMHAATIIGHLAVMTMGASLNHAGFDLEIRFLGVDWYSTGAHEMHHRRPDKNFAQFTMFWDKLMGTYIPYTDELSDANAQKAK